MSLRAVSITFGMRVMPPTSTSSFISFSDNLASAKAVLHRLDRPLEKRVGELLQFGTASISSECASARSHPL